jgi:hypothetical protein
MQVETTLEEEMGERLLEWTPFDMLAKYFYNANLWGYSTCVLDQVKALRGPRLAHGYDVQVVNPDIPGSDP